jgi:Carboxypeptidase regulatory-like domain/TonB-dependent Receptor Plug Domain
MGSKRVWVVLLFVVHLISGTKLMAQTASTGALTGTITDPTGAVVTGATVTLTSVDTGQARTTMTMTDGTYQFTLLAPGNYRVRIEAPGFKPVEIPSATVSVTETAVLNRALEVGTQTQSVTVEGEVEAIQTTSSALGTVMNSATTTEIPLNTRNYTNLLSFSAGVAGNVSNATTLGTGATNMNVNGAASNQNTYAQDGVTINNWNGVTGVSEGQQFGAFAMPNPDAIAEFKIQTSSYDASFGRNPGANVNVVTKSGTNNFHGDVFEFFRNTVLNANSWLLNRQGVAKPALNSNIYGGTVGGPIKKDKLFFFTSYQEDDQTNGYAAYSNSSVTLAPIPDNAAGSRGTCGPVPWYTIASCDTKGANFVTALAQNMCGNKPKNGTATIQCPGAGNPDPNGLFGINPIAINLLQLQLPNDNYLVPGSGTSGFLSTSFVQPTGFKDHQGIGNIDWVINSKNTFTGRYMAEANPLHGSFEATNSQEPGAFLEGTPIVETKRYQNVLAKLTTIISNNMVNEFHVGYQRDEALASQDILFTDQQVGVQPFVSPFAPGGVFNGLSQMSINGSVGSGQFSFGYHHGYGSTNVRDNQYEVGDQISWTHSKHSFRAGFEIERVLNGFLNASSSLANPSFPTFADFLLGRQDCGAGIVSSPTAALPGGCNGGTNGKANVSGAGGSSAANGIVETSINVLELSSYIQDDIKLFPRFTLNAGLRWELDQNPTDPTGDISNFWPSLASTAPPPFVTVPGGPEETLAGIIVPSNYNGVVPAGVYQSPLPYAQMKSAPWDNFAPRLGLAWQPTSSHRFVIRAGVGYFYAVLGGHDIARFDLSNPTHGVAASNSPIASLYDPFAIPPGLVSAGAGSFGFVPRWVDPSTVSLNPSAFCKTPPCSSNDSLTIFDPNLSVPLTYEWNLNTQYEFLPSWVLEVGYVGSHGIHQASPGAANTAVGADASPAGQPYNYAQLAGTGAPCVNCGVTGVTTNTTANVALRVPYLGISPTSSYDQTNSNYKYNSLQVTVRKQMSHGLQLQAAYTWARGFVQSAQGVNTYPYIVQTYSPEYFVRPQRLILNYVWNLPFGNEKGLLGRVAGAWTWSGVVTLQNGNPLDFSDSRVGSIFGATSGNATLCPGMTAANIATSGSTVQRITNGLNGGDGWINSAAFCAPPAIGNGTGFGTLGQGLIPGPGQNNWDMNIQKVIKIRESQSLMFRAEFFNTFNHPQFASYLNDSDPTDAGKGFGAINAMSVNPRVIQLALKYLF